MEHLTAPRMEKCIGCQLCALACARIVYKHVGWSRSGIHIESTQVNLNPTYSAHYCLACDPPPCAENCPTKALVPQKKGGVFFHQDLCTQCGMCKDSCVTGAIYQDSEGHISLCIHCGSCIDFCPQNCLEMQDIKG